MTAMIEVVDLVKHFGSLRAVDGLSFTVQAGTIRAFLGPNGAGKTTTIKILTTVLAPTSGRIKVAGHDPVHQRAAVRRALGIVFQDPSVDDELTAYENMELHGVLYGVPRKVLRERTEALLGFVGLWGRRNDYVKQFSGGMKRRLEIARALPASATPAVPGRAHARAGPADAQPYLGVRARTFARASGHGVLHDACDGRGGAGG